MNSVIEVLAPRYGIAWYPWAVQYFFLIAVSYSALLLTVPGFLFGKKNYESLAKVALLVTVSCTLVGPVALLADLHQPLRFWHFYASDLTPSVVDVHRQPDAPCVSHAGCDLCLARMASCHAGTGAR